MSSIANVWIKKDTLRTLLEVVEKKGEKGVAIDFGIWDEVNEEYRQNVNAWVAQTKEQREEKKDKFYVANGRVVWSDTEGVVVVPFKKPDEEEKVGGFPVAKDAPKKQDDGESDGLPF